MCYEGNVDLSSETDFGKRHALEVQIMEFGQIPKQLFTVPHPSRLQLGSLSEPDSPKKGTSDEVSHQCSEPILILPTNYFHSNLG